MKISSVGTEAERALADKFARAICDNLREALQRADSPYVLHEAATWLARDLGTLLTDETTTDFAQLLPAAVDTHLFAPADNEVTARD